MKVEFSQDEVHTMLESVVDQLIDLKLKRADQAAIRRGRSDMSPGTASMQLLVEKLNAELQREYDRSEVTPIKKPDWAS